jgi:nucleotide-binding universal stress UspA family protein
MTALRTEEPAQRAASRTILAVELGAAAAGAVEAAAVMARLTGADLIERRLVHRHEGHEIAATAREEAADLVVLDARSHPSRHVARLLRPALNAGFRVLALPADAPAELRLERIGVAHDGSRDAQRALMTAIDLVGSARAEVARFDVIYVDDALERSDEPHVHELASRRDAIIEWWLDALSDEAPAIVCPLRLVGEPARALADLSRDLDLLILGTRRRRLRSLVASSVSDSLLAHASCPLLIVPDR